MQSGAEMRASLWVMRLLAIEVEHRGRDFYDFGWVSRTHKGLRRWNALIGRPRLLTGLKEEQKSRPNTVDD
jgi:hypothetical protein